MRATSTLGLLVVPMVLATFAPAGSAAQPLAMNTEASEPDPAGAAALHDEAMRLTAATRASGRLSKRQLREIADLHVRSARMRTAADPEAVSCLREAAELLHRIHPERTAALLEESADRALARGDVASAARTYLDLASYLQGRKSRNAEQEVAWQVEALKFAQKGKLLAESPLLDKTDRAALLQRFDTREWRPVAKK